MNNKFILIIKNKFQNLIQILLKSKDRRFNFIHDKNNLNNKNMYFKILIIIFICIILFSIIFFMGTLKPTKDDVSDTLTLKSFVIDVNIPVDKSSNISYKKGKRVQIYGQLFKISESSLIMKYDEYILKFEMKNKKNFNKLVLGRKYKIQGKIKDNVLVGEDYIELVDCNLIFIDNTGDRLEE